MEHARVVFRFRAEIYDAKLNFKNNKAYKEERYLCDSCQSEVDENTHVLYCPSYRQLREDKDLQNDRDLAMYLQRVLAIRTRLRLTR